MPTSPTTIAATVSDEASANTVDIPLPLSAPATVLLDLASRMPPAGKLVYLDANTVRPPRRPNRDESAFTSAEYYKLLNDIRRTRGNRVPIKVLRHEPPPDGGEAELETIFGERRRRACCEAGAPLLAVVVDELDSQGAVIDQISENRSRVDFSPFELGRIYLANVSSFGSQKQMSDRMGKQESEISRAMDLARLPSEVVCAFESSADLQYRHAKRLREAVAANRQAVIAKAVALAQEPGPRSAAMVFARLTGAAVTPAADPIGPSNSGTERAFRVNRRAAGRLFRNAEGVSMAEFRKPLDQDETEAVAVAIEGALSACAAARRTSRDTKRKASAQTAPPAGTADAANDGAPPQILQPPRIG